MSFCAAPVFLAFLLNRCSIRFFPSCRCVLGFTPFSASIIFGFSLVALLLKHPELYPCWLRRVNFKIMFLYELFASLIFIEIGFCIWNSIETFLFYSLPAFLEDFCNPVGDFYIHLVETEVGVSIISNLLALSMLMLSLHITRIVDFDLLLRSNGVHKFFADAGLTSKLCRHRREFRLSERDSVCHDLFRDSDMAGDCCPRICTPPKYPTKSGGKMLRSDCDSLLLGSLLKLPSTPIALNLFAPETERMFFTHVKVQMVDISEVASVKYS